MKKSIIILSSVLFLISCGNNTETKDETKTDTAATVKEEPKDPEIQKGLDLIAKSDCFTCHKLNEAAIGPSYALVAAKYSTIDRQAAVDSVVHQIINGGSGKWGTVPMTPHPALSQDEAKSMAAYVLSIKKE
ncbi:MAG: c-type cytochrome [Ginsengibacter sp.]